MIRYTSAPMGPVTTVMRSSAWSLTKLTTQLHALPVYSLIVSQFLYTRYATPAIAAMTMAMGPIAMSQLAAILIAPAVDAAAAMSQLRAVAVPAAVSAVAAV